MPGDVGNRCLVRMVVTSPRSANRLDGSSLHPNRQGKQESKCPKGGPPETTATKCWWPSRTAHSWPSSAPVLAAPERERARGPARAPSRHPSYRPHEAPPRRMTRSSTPPVGCAPGRTGPSAPSLPPVEGRRSRPPVGR
jgi:hypothetical protein